MRLFFAAALSPNALDIAKNLQGRAQERLKASAWRWTKPSQWHVTLKFLGPTEKELVPDLSHLLDRVSREIRAIDLCFNGLGVFGSTHSPRVFWLGLKDPKKSLKELAMNLEEAVADFGFAKEHRPFKPHITLARVKGRLSQDEQQAFEAFLRENKPENLFQVHEIALFQSKLSSSGSRYVPLHRVRLA